MDAPTGDVARGRGKRQIWQGGGRSFGLSARVGESKRNSFGMVSLHGCTGKSTTVREEIFRYFSSSVALPQAEVFRELKGGCREVNGGLNTLVQARHSSCEFNTCLPRALLYEHG